MKLLKILMIAGMIALFLIAPAYASLTTPNLVQNSSFDFAASTAGGSSTSLTPGIWYSSPGWSWVTSGGYSMQFEQLGNNKDGYLFQLMDPSFTATAGPVEVQFFQMKQNTVNKAEIALYGYGSVPLFGNIITEGAIGGTLITGPTSTSPETSWTEWNSSNASANSGYNYYLIWIHAVTGEKGSNFRADDVSVKVAPVPIPAASWLLGTGLVGLVIVRRRMKK